MNRGLATATAGRFGRLAARLVRTRTLRSRLRAPLVSFTFDDIPESACREGAAILETHGARGTFYVAGGLAGTGEVERRLADVEQCVALHRRGHEIGCHTFSHPSVKRCGAAALDDEIARNQAFFSGHDSSIVLENFAYPYNETSLAAKRHLERRFQTCRGGVPGINAGRIDAGFLRTVELIEGRLKPDAARTWIERARARCGWLVFLTHDVSERPGPWGCTPGLLDAAIRDAQALGVEIVTVREAVRRVQGRIPA